jgi:hypothetical protein
MSLGSLVILFHSWHLPLTTSALFHFHFFSASTSLRSTKDHAIINKNNNDWYLLNTYHMSSMALKVMFWFISWSQTLWGKYYWYYHVKQENTEAQEWLSNMLSCSATYLRPETRLFSFQLIPAWTLNTYNLVW